MRIHVIPCFNIRYISHLWNGVIPTPAPGVTATDALDGEPETLEKAIPPESFQPIGRAGGREAAGRWHPRRDGFAVKQDQHNKGKRQYLKKFFHARLFAVTEECIFPWPYTGYQSRRSAGRRTERR